MLRSTDDVSQPWLRQNVGHPHSWLRQILTRKTVSRHQKTATRAHHPTSPSPTPVARTLSRVFTQQQVMADRLDHHRQCVTPKVTFFCCPAERDWTWTCIVYSAVTTVPSEPSSRGWREVERHWIKFGEFNYVLRASW